LSALLRHGCIAAMFLAASAPHRALAEEQSRPPSIEAAIKSSSEGEVQAFYEARNFKPIWIKGGLPRPEVDQLIELLSSAHLDGLDPEDYKPGALAKLVRKARGGSPEALAKAEIRLSRSFAAYVRDVRHPREVGMVYLDRELRPAVPSVEAVLASAASAPSLKDHLKRLDWANPIYADLRHGIAKYHQRWGGLPRARISPGPALGHGATGKRVIRLRKRLGLPEDGSFDQAVLARLSAFKAAHGLPPGPLADEATIAALNRGARYYERVIALNLDRARALPANLGRKHVVVDALGARLRLYEDGKLRDTMRVIVGKPSEPTPMMAGLMRYAVVNPYWNVPPDLVRVRVAPKVLGNGISYFKSMRYEALSDWTTNARLVDPQTVDWAAIAAGKEELRVRQLPGGDNMMGRMKFMFPNDLGIYLHDTPAKELFRDGERRFSSGCVRVEDAPRLARWLFGRNLRARSSKPEQHVDLADPVPVYITYLTAVPNEDGIAFRMDAYGRDQVKGR
jgi:murein L,D-transpeptidase YcbB/YkuD